jgi:hypothetical protein
VWAPWLQSFAETLDPHLAETKQQEESKLWHPEPLACGKHLHTKLHWENRRAPTATRCQLQTCLGDILQTKQVNTKYHVVYPQPPLVLKKKMNNKQGTENYHTAEGRRCWKCTGEGGRSKELISTWTLSKQRLERQKGQQQAGNKPLSEIGQVAVHKAQLLSQWGTYKVKWHCKIEKQSANHHNTLTTGGRLMDHWTCPRERRRNKETSHQ